MPCRVKPTLGSALNAVTDHLDWQAIGLPTPGEDALAHSARVHAHIQDDIEANGPMSFARFMALALYAPGLGYYCVGNEVFGAQGDFVTAPEISSLFGHCLGQTIHPVLTAMEGGGVLELGAGTGKMAADIMQGLQGVGHAQANDVAAQSGRSLPIDHYMILEPSPDLQARQRQHIVQSAPEYVSKVQWLETLPTQFSGVMIANEVLDAMPVHLIEFGHDQVFERCVGVRDDQFVWHQQLVAEGGVATVDCSDEQRQLVEQVNRLGVTFAPGYVTEINLALSGWVNSLADVLDRGQIIIIDYGFPGLIYYHPQRSMGTLMCHFQHRAHSNPLILPGIQDFTAHVDFTAVGLAAETAGLTVETYCTQAKFLLDNGLLELVEQQAINLEQHMSLANEVKRLTMPNEMGELFKVMVLGGQLGGQVRGSEVRL